MPNVTRRYMFVGPSNAALQRYAGPTTSVAATFAGPIIDVSVNNVPGDIAALDEYMSSIGYSFSVAAAPLSTSLIPYAPLTTIASPLTQFIGFGGLSISEDLTCWVAPRAGTLKTLQVNVPVNTLIGTATFTVRVSPAVNNPFANTTLQIVVPAGGTGTFTSSASVALAIGDRVSLQIVTGGLAGLITFSAGLEVA